MLQHYIDYSTIYLHILEVNKKENTSTLISRNIRLLSIL